MPEQDEPDGHAGRDLRPTEVDALIGDASKAAETLGWKAHTHTPELAALMVDADLEIAMAEAARSR